MHVFALASTIPSFPLTAQYYLHVILTVALFLANLILNQFLGGDTFIGRLKYIGNEMVYLASGLVVSHLFVAGSERERLVTITTVVIYLLIWLVIILMTRRVIQINPTRLDALTCATIFVGILSVWFAMGGFVESLVTRGFSGAS